MRYDYDSYLFYEVTPQEELAVRLKVNLCEEVHAGVLDRSAQQAWKRFGYFAKSCELDEQGAYVLRDNDAPLTVLPETNRPVTLGSEQTGGLFFAITYSESAIYFNYFRGFCGKNGALLWIKCTLWQYLYNVHHTDIDTTGILLPDAPVTPEELAVPDPDALPADEPIYEYLREDSYVPLADSSHFQLMPHLAKALYFPITIDQDSLMDCARKHEGTPTSVICALTYKALIRKYGGSPKANVISARIPYDYSIDVDCPDTYHDLTRMLHVRYTHDATGWPLSKLSTIARGSMLLQREPELSWKAYRELMGLRDEIDELDSLRKKTRHAKANGTYTTAKDTYMVSYTGQVEWGGLADYIDSVYTLTNGHLMLEVNSLPGAFNVAFHILGRRRRHLDAFLQVLEEEGISHTIGEPEDTRMPRVSLPS